MSVPAVPRYSQEESDFNAIRNMNVQTQYIDANGKVYNYCLLRQLVNYLGLLKYDIVRNLFRRCCSENIITARENLQRKITAYERVDVSSELSFAERKKLITEAEAKFNAVVDRINQNRPGNGLSRIPDQAKFDPSLIENRWNALQKDITRRDLTKRLEPTSPPSPATQPLHTSMLGALTANLSAPSPQDANVAK